MLCTTLAQVVLTASLAATDPVFEVTFDGSVRSEPASGRLVVYLISETSAPNLRQAPADGPFFDDPQPMFGIDVKAMSPGIVVKLDSAATAFPIKLRDLPAGAYRVQAVLDMHRDDSSWKREPGNLYSDVVSMRLNEADGPEVHPIKLTKVVEPRIFEPAKGVEEFSLRSALLSDFHKREVTLRAGVRLPVAYDPAADKRYPVIYEVPGFGGDHRAIRRQPQALGGAAVWIILNPESGNGHTLFADSANNGPWGRALVEELIPALEARYKLIPEASARILRGHSSGGWSTLWLALNYPETFGATWSSSPDPVDFRRFQSPDIYGQPSMYIQAGGKDFTSYRGDGQDLMTIRQENAMEEVLGPDNTSGQQWDSWFAVFGPQNERGNPSALFDPATGVIDASIAKQYRKYDIADLLRNDPARYAPIFHQRIRLIVGDQDNFFLNEAVALLKADLDNLPPSGTSEDRRGYIKIVPGRDHGTIFMTPEMQSIQGEILDHFRRHGHAAK